MRTLGILAPLPAEALTFSGRRHVPGDVVELEAGVVLCLCGVGAEHAAAGARALVERGADALVSWGTTGGLAPSLPVGALVLPTRVHAPDGSVFATDPRWRARLTTSLSGAVEVHAGDLVESARVLATPTSKVEAHRATGAVAVDMESAAIAAVAHATGRTFLAVRSVSDGVSMRVPRASLVSIDLDGRRSWPRFARALLRRPADVVALVRMDRGFRSAARTLTRVATLAGARLCADDEG